MRRTKGPARAASKAEILDQRRQGAHGGSVSVPSPTPRPAALRTQAEAEPKPTDRERRARWSAVGRLASGVAHEINNPLAALKSNASVVIEQLAELRAWLVARAGALTTGAPTAASDALPPNGLLTDLEEMARESAEGIERITALVGALNATAHDCPDARWFDVGRAVRDAAVLVSAGSRPRGQLELQTDALPAVYGDPAGLRHALVDLMQIAVAGLTGPGHVAVSATLDDDGVRVVILGAGGPNDTARALERQHEVVAAWRTVRRMGGRLTWIPEGAAFLMELPTEPGRVDGSRRC